MNRRFLLFAAIALVVFGIVAMSSLFIVDQTEEALVLRFGKAERIIPTPGLWTKWPFIENVIIYDKRVLDFDPPPEEVIAADQKRLVVDAYTRYRITDPLLFYQSVRSAEGVRQALAPIVNGSLRRVIGDVPLSALLSAQRADIMHKIRDDVSVEAKGFGITVIDVRIRRADLPPQNSEAIYARMQSERQQQAKKYRAEGAQAAQTVRANADRERTVILADAQRDAQKLRGEGDAASIRIYAKAYSQDPNFFAFWRSLKAYRRALAGHGTTFVLSPEGSFFRYFRDWRGAASAPASTGPRAAGDTPAKSPGATASGPSKP